MRKPTTLKEYNELKGKTVKSMRDRNILKRITEYDLQAWELCDKLNISIDVHMLGTFPHFPDDKESRDCYQITLTRGKAYYSFRYGDSIQNTEMRTGTIKPNMGEPIYKHDRRCLKAKAQWHKPDAYSVLACLTSYDPDTFKNFCSDFGYNEDSMKAMDTYLNVQKEWEGVRTIFRTDDELEMLQEVN